MKLTNLLKYSGITSLLLIFITFQSCNVYHSPSYSLDMAIEKEKSIKILDKNMQTLKFDYITKDGDNLIGHAKTNSKTTKLLKDDIISIDENGKMASISIDPNNVLEIKVKNGAASAGAKVGSGLGIAAIAIISAYILALVIS